MAKLFKWKKTNFVTDVPKHSPISKYLVAKTKFANGEYFMHAAVLHQGKITHHFKSEFNL